MQTLQTMVIPAFIFYSLISLPPPPLFKNEIFHCPLQMILKILYVPFKTAGGGVHTKNSHCKAWSYKMIKTYWNCDRKILLSIRITSRPPSRIRKWNQLKEKNFMAPLYGWGSTASTLEPLRGGSLLVTTKFLEILVLILSTSIG